MNPIAEPKAVHYIRMIGRELMPGYYYKQKFKNYQKEYDNYKSDLDYNHRLKQYFQLTKPFSLPNEAVKNKDFKFQKPSPYYFDLKEFLFYFKPDFAFAYEFGDSLQINSYPSLIKARPIEKGNENSILYLFNKRRHFYFVNDTINFQDKKNMLVWRGAAHNPTRQLLLKKYFNNSVMDVGEVGNFMNEDGYQKPKMSIQEQLKYKYIFCPEGNDVATSLKWILSSNSVCIMPKPTRESWFLENELEPNIHYVEVRSDLNDLEEKMNWINQQPKLANEIIMNAHEHVNRFRDNTKEDLLCLSILNRYAELSGQGNQFRWE